MKGRERHPPTCNRLGKADRRRQKTSRGSGAHLIRRRALILPPLSSCSVPRPTRREHWLEPSMHSEAGMQPARGTGCSSCRRKHCARTQAASLADATRYTVSCTTTLWDETQRSGTATVLWLALNFALLQYAIIESLEREGELGAR